MCIAGHWLTFECYTTLIYCRVYVIYKRMECQDVNWTSANMIIDMKWPLSRHICYAICVELKELHSQHALIHFKHSSTSAFTLQYLDISRYHRQLAMCLHLAMQLWLHKCQTDYDSMLCLKNLPLRLILTVFVVFPCITKKGHCVQSTSDLL